MSFRIHFVPQNLQLLISASKPFSLLSPWYLHSELQAQLALMFPVSFLPQNIVDRLSTSRWVLPHFWRNIIWGILKQFEAIIGFLNPLGASGTWIWRPSSLLPSSSAWGLWHLSNSINFISNSPKAPSSKRPTAPLRNTSDYMSLGVNRIYGERNRAICCRIWQVLEKMKQREWGWRL